MDTIATTRQGRLEGRVKDGVLLFAGVPYAAPPVGELRFRAPQPAESWSGVRPAQRFGKVAPQAPSPLGGFLDRGKADWDEDCLTLNVTTPALDAGRRPVVVWIHGGGFVTGMGSVPWYNGSSFARRGDLVVVTINYRLGALGFLHLGELDPAHAESGTNGIQDQVAALRWVRDNIEAFGGDPENVTIFGESAGGMSVGTLLAVPDAKGLFHRAIAQSGAGHHTLGREAAARVTDLFLEQAAVRTLEALRNLPADEILDAQVRLAAHVMKNPRSLVDDRGEPLGMAFRPVVGGDALPVRPIDAVRKGSAAGVPLLVGTTRDEHNLFMIGNPPKLDRDRLTRRLARLHGDGDRAASTYAAARPDASPDELFSAAMTDLTFRIPAVRLAEAQHEHEPRTWGYLFSWASRAFGGRLGACHAIEIPFVFNNLEKPGVDLFLGAGDLPGELALSMHDAWIAFARSGDPNHAGIPEWPAYDVERRATFEFGEALGVLDDPGAAERALWDRLV